MSDEKKDEPLPEIIGSMDVREVEDALNRPQPKPTEKDENP